MSENDNGGDVHEPPESSLQQHFTYILASQSTAKRTGLEESEGKEDFVLT